MTEAPPSPVEELDPKIRREMARRVLARRSLIAFTKRFLPNYEPGWVHHDIARRLEQFLRDVEAKNSPRLMLLVPPRHGKALEVGTLVPTPDGMVPIEVLRPGDQVFGGDGLPVDVVAASPVWRNRPVYEVTTDDGASVIADAEHEWTVRLCRKHKKYKTKTTRWLAERTSLRAPALQSAAPVQYDEQNLPVPPYVLGVWLGDGCTGHATITQGARDFAFIRAEIERFGVRTSDRSTAGTFGLLNTLAPLRQLDVLRNKHIPPIYLRASVEQRRALLQGLIDTDGYVAPDGQVEYCSTTKTLALDVLELVRSLGVKASLILGRATLNGRDCGEKYRVMFYMAGAARLPRKEARCRNNERTPHRFLNFCPAGVADTVCIQVAAPDGQFLVGEGYILTHNSELGSVRFPAWTLGHHPEWEFINCGYNLDLPMKFSRKVREMIRDPSYTSIFERAVIDKESQSAEAWMTTAGGGFTAAGVGGGITGKGAHILEIDDPIKNQEEADSITARDSLWDWYWSTAYSRLSPGGGVLLIQCMTGDTHVLMADGSEKRIDAITVGEEVATWDDGVLTTEVVTASSSNGVDKVFCIRTNDGKVVRANARHPFLVEHDTGGAEWIQLQHLKLGQRVVALAPSAGSGKASNAAQTAATGQLSAEGSARPTTTNSYGPLATGLLRRGRQRLIRCAARSCVAATGCLTKVMQSCWSSRIIVAPFAGSTRLRSQPLNTGTSRSASTTAPRRATPEVCSATTATSSSSEAKQLPIRYSARQTTSDFTTSVIESITPDGEEEVFDLTVNRTHCFIGCGLVTHNTCWSDDDLAGRLQQRMADAANDPEEHEDVDNFTIIRYPAMAEKWEYHNKVTDLIDRFDAPLDAAHTSLRLAQREAGTSVPNEIDETYTLLRMPGEALHPERFTEKMIRRLKANQPPRVWSALYQQNPVPDEGIYFRQEYFKLEPRPPEHFGRKVYQAWDFAIGEKQQNDWTVGATLVQDETDNLHVVELVRFKGDSFTIVEEILDAAERWGSEGTAPLRIGFEDGQIWRSIKPLLEKRMAERRQYPPYTVLRPLTDKLARARPLQGRMQQGRLWFPKDASWLPEVQKELLRFPAAAHDDIVDALAWAVTLAVGEAPPKGRQPRRLKSWKDKLTAVGAFGSGSHMSS
jgi:predicted phage terminase large subunit-like protein